MNELVPERKVNAGPGAQVGSRLGGQVLRFTTGSWENQNRLLLIPISGEVNVPDERGSPELSWNQNGSGSSAGLLPSAR